MTKNSTQRFTDRVRDYSRYRPGYPDGVLAALQREGGLSAEAVVADIGSGTGISAELILRAGCEVYAVEPNRAMRESAEERLGGNPRFRSVAGSAEATTLADGSVDLVTAAQAFHWFDARRARDELRRILRPDGRVALFWNTRDAESTAFLRAYERLLREHATDYSKVDHRNVDAALIEAFFGESPLYLSMPNEQRLDYEGLKGRLLSSSYTPADGDPAREPMLHALRRIFDEHAQDGEVQFLYTTELWIGRRFAPAPGRSRVTR